MRRIVSWLRVTLPNSTWTAIPVLLLALVEVTCWLLTYLAGDAVAQEVRAVRTGVAVAFAGAYGIWRVYGFHPLHHDDYRAWLELTPWNWTKPLPLGPILPVAQDAVWIGLFVAYSRGPWINVWHVVAAAITGYLIAVGESLYMAKDVRNAYAIGLGFGFVVFLYRPQPALAAVFLVAILGVACYAAREGLKRFPWLDAEPRLMTRSAMSIVTELPLTFGWPFFHLSPHSLPESSRGMAVLNGCLAAWLSWAAAWQVDPDVAIGLGIVAFFFCLSALMRFLYLIVHYWTPISLVGRITTGRWIVPGFDRVLVMPLLAVAVFRAGWISAVNFPPLALYVLPVTIGLLVAIPGTIGPSPGQWQLCGHHRLVPGVKKAGVYEEI